MKIKKYSIINIFAVLAFILAACTPSGTYNEKSPVSFAEIPEYSDSAYIEINNNIPFFGEKDYTTKSFESYSEPDHLGRCGAAFSNIGTELMPTEERGYIGQVKPSGWQISKYDFIDGKYLYNRCHLIAYQLTGENANEKNLITGTRYLNINGMLPFENMVADYIRESKNHVLYRVAPVFEGDNLIASGVIMEAKSVEDNGEGICFNVYCYNVQPGVRIDYSDGSNLPDEQYSDITSEVSGEITYIANKNSKIFHSPQCKSIEDMKEKNKKYLSCTREEALKLGYTPCGSCKP